MANIDIYGYMREIGGTARIDDTDFMKILRHYGRDMSDYTSHLPLRRNSEPKARNTLAALIFQALSDEKLDKILPILKFIELSTCATYVQDDIIDDQPNREGDESTWKRFGVNKAIIAGGLQTFLGFEALKCLEISNDTKVKIYEIANTMWQKLWVGEGFNEEMREGTTLNEYLNRCNNICGVMFDSVAHMSAIVANANNERVKLARDIGRNYGIAVMIRNDLSDWISDISEHSRALSKKPFEDLRKEIWTYPVIYAMEKGDDASKKFLSNAMQKNLNQKDLEKITHIMHECGAFNATLDLITKYKVKAQSSIKSFPESLAKERLYLFTELLENLRGYRGKF